jgi:hypothetical protein
MNPSNQPRKRRTPLVIFASILGVFSALVIIGTLLPDEPPFDVLKPEDCNNDWFRRELNRRIRGHGVIYELNPASGSLQEGGIVCTAFPQTDRGVLLVTYAFRWTDKSKKRWELKYI